MVSVNPNSPEGFYLDANGMALPGLGSFATPTTSTSTASVPTSANAAVTSAEDASKKIRKPYTISKSRESWTEPEHDKFLEALQLFDRDWKKIEAFVGSKTVIQIRSHAQKYFLKVQKSGSNEHLPPPRPKRKAAHPYPQKAPKIDSPLAPRDPNNNTALSPWTAQSAQTNGTPAPKGDVGSNGPVGGNNCSSSVESTPMPQAINEITEQTNNAPALRVLPDFAQVYSFIGSVFDPGAKEHVQRLKKMDPIDVETVLLLMRNLSINLASPDFEDHRRLLASYEVDPEKAGTGGTNDTFGGD